jgi:hypothetical protein
LENDIELAFQALFNDPTNHLPIDSSWDLFNSIRELNREFLPTEVVVKNRVQNVHTQSA